MTDTPQPRANPYVGPRAFQQGETLYGRGREVTQLLHLLLAERIVLLHSLSGAGKTSLIQAALIPELEKEGFHVLPPMRVSLGPSADEQRDNQSNRYVFGLLLSLEEALPPEQRTSLAELSTLTLAEYLDRRQDGDGAVGTVLIFDQFEEILTLDPIDRGLKLEFFAQVGAALRNRRRWALFAMREEFIAGLEEPYLRPIPTRLRASYRLGLLVPQYARQAIQEPAKAAGVTFSDAAADKLVRDLSTVRVLQPNGSIEKRLGPYVEPVQLQVVCSCLWDLLPAGASQIVEEDIGLLADVDLALSGYYDHQVQAALSGYYADQVKAADSRFSRLKVRVKKAFETAFGFGVTEGTIRNWFNVKLITEQGMRGQVLRGPKESEGLDNGAIRPLVGANLVRAEKRRGATWFELAHDRLIEPVQASNAAWQQARRNRKIAVGFTLMAILAIALALLVRVQTQRADSAESTVAVLKAQLSATTTTVKPSPTDTPTPTPPTPAPTTTVTPVNKPPTVTISAPADGKSFDEGEAITFTGSASDAEDEDEKVTASLLWESSRDVAIGWGDTFTRSDLSVGSHTITATVTDSGDSTVSKTVTITVKKPPTVTIIAPANGAIFEAGEVITFTGSARVAEAEPEDEAEKVTARLEWVLSIDDAIDSGGSFSTSDLSAGTHTITATVSTSDLSVGSHTITATITDSVGSPDSDTVTIKVNKPPTVTISAPPDGAIFYEDEGITFTGSVTDVEDVELKARLLWESRRDGAIGWGGTFTRSDLSVGSHTITATVTDSGGSTVSKTVTITVKKPPTVTIIAPANGAIFGAGEVITFTGSASDVEDKDEKVTDRLEWESSRDVAIGWGDTFTRSDLSVGSHTITATVTDSGELTATAEITIEICAEVQGDFAGLWKEHRDDLGCPSPPDATPMFIQDAEQAFEKGHMFWRADTEGHRAEIYVVYDEQGDGACKYQKFSDTSSEHDGGADPCEASPPQGWFPPVRGFRVAWCHLNLKDSLGWGLEGELGFGPGYGDPLVQQFERGLIFRDSGGTTYVLFGKEREKELECEIPKDPQP